MKLCKLIILIGILIVIFVIFMILRRNNILKQKERYTVSTSDNDDYVVDWNNFLFVKAIDDNIINYMVCYHYISTFPYIDNKFNIMLDGEPKDLTNVKVDVIITTKKERLPYNTPSVYVPYFTHVLKNPKALIKTHEDYLIYKSKFCCFMYSNCDEKFDGVVNRKRFLDLMNKMTGNRVDNLGRCYNENAKEDINRNFRINDLIFKPYKFVIAFENSQIKGYITEKLVMPMVSRAIPIYLGASDVGNYFNTRSFINVNEFPTFESCIEYIMEVDRNDDLYRSIMAEPYLLSESESNIKDIFSIHYGGRVYREIYDMFKPFGLSKFIRPCNLYSNNILFITFADGVVYKSDRIVSEATESRFFKHVKAYSPVDFDPEFKIEHNNFIKNNKRGYGYWIWKPYFILKSLSELEDNDFLIWSDSGTTINYKAYERMKELYTLLETNDIVAFHNGYYELRWTKQDTVQAVLNALNKSENDYHLSIEKQRNQYCTGFMMIKKTINTMKMVELWYKLMLNYHLIDDSPSILPNHPTFIENRHDQSIYSLLIRFTPKVVTEEEVENSKSPIIDTKVFHATRKKK